MLFKIYCKNIMVAFFYCHFLFFILFLLSLVSFHPYVSFLFFFFFFSYFSPPHTLSCLYHSLLLFSFSLSFKNIPAAIILSFFSPALSLFVFLLLLLLLFLLNSRTFVPNIVQMGHLHPKAVGPAWSHCSSSSPTQSKWVRWLLSSVFFFLPFYLLFFLWFD